MTAALILCGGAGTRMGGLNKPLIELEGTALLERVIDRLAPQVDEIVISANQDIDAYERLGFPVVRDATSSLGGPLAGVWAGMHYLVQAGREKDYRVQLAPGDTPFLPTDLIARLRGPETLVPFDGDRAHHLHSQMTIEAALAAFDDAAKGSAVHRWLDRQRARRVDFSDRAEAFLNINTAEQLKAAKQRLDEPNT